MKLLLGILFLVIGLVPFGYLTIKEKDRKTYWKMMITSYCSMFILGGTILLLSSIVQ